MISVYINIICFSISASREYKQSNLWWELHWCQLKNNNTIWTPWCWRKKDSAQSPKCIPDTQYKMIYLMVHMEEILQIMPT